MKNYLRKIWYFLILLTPLSAFAQSSDTGDNSLGSFLHAFTPSTYSSNDLSMTYLGQIFGSVGGVVSGNNGQLLGRLFEAFNNGLLVIAGLFLTYTIFKAVIDTAGDGQVMGRNPKGGGPGWTAFRTAMGIGCLIPSKASGYCLIQVFFMWVVTQGIGLADMVWGRAIDYLAEEGGAIYVTNPYDLSNNPTQLVDTVGQVLQSSICMYRLQNTIEANNQANVEASGGTATPDSTTVGSGWVTTDNGQTMTLSFGKNTGEYTSDGQVKWGDDCGSYTIKQDPNYDPNTTSSSGSSPLTYKQMALNQVVIDVGQVAKQTASLETTDQISTVNDQSVTAMTNGSTDYTNIITPSMNKEVQDGEQEAKDQLEKARDQGWIVAGSYYRQLGTVNQHVTDDINNYLPTANNSTGFSAMNGGELSNDDVAKAALNAVNSGDNPYTTQTSEALSEIAQNDTSGIKPISPKKIENGILGMGQGKAVSSIMLPISAAMALINGGVGIIAYQWEQVVNNKITDKNPIVVLQSFGNSIIMTVTLIWVLGTLTVLVSSIAVSTCTAVTGVGEAVISGVLMFVPILMGVLLTLLAAGLLFAVYVPLIPFLVYLFATLGWFVLVLEAMIAAPLVAIGITHPEGHDVLGKAEQAILMLLGVFLRPVMLLIGFLAAMIMVRVSIQVLNLGFRTVTDSAMGNLNIFTTAGLLVAYTLIVMYIVQLVFEMCITKVPAFASEWMSIRARHDESRGLEVAKGAVDSAGGAASEWGKSTSQNAGQTSSQIAKSGKDRQLGVANSNPAPNPTPNP